ncbi:MAG: DNA gyrase inhibitor YacG [Gammaproteobacteria bacterium]|nr:DNA gyrase inhibitor YacG [Gammaproteobacteria bacterium]
MTSVNCPHCKKAVIWNAESRWRPFCSERCSMIDLGAWADERYAVPDTDTDIQEFEPSTAATEVKSFRDD